MRHDRPIRGPRHNERTIARISRTMAIGRSLWGLCIRAFVFLQHSCALRRIVHDVRFPLFDDLADRRQISRQIAACAGMVMRSLQIDMGSAHCRRAGTKDALAFHPSSAPMRRGHIRLCTGCAPCVCHDRAQP